MQPQRDISTLHPAFRSAVRRLQGFIAAEGLGFELYEAFRGRARQEDGFKRGKSRAHFLQSWHNYGMAADFVWKTPSGRWSWANGHPWGRLGELAKQCGLSWAGDWQSFRELVHVQLGTGRANAADIGPGQTDHVDEWATWIQHVWFPNLDQSKRVDRREVARAVQVILNYLGASLAVDGIAGPRTREAMQERGVVNPLDQMGLAALVAAVKEGE